MSGSNLVTTRCVASSASLPALSAFFLAAFKGLLFDGTRLFPPYFDFGAALPLPSAFDDVVDTPWVDDGLLAMGLRRVPERAGVPMANPFNSSRYANMGVANTDELRHYLEQHKPEALQYARAALRALADTGCMLPAEWMREHWGTISNAQQSRVVRMPARDPTTGRYLMEFTFVTPETFPEPVFRAFAAQHPQVVLRVWCFHEGWGFAGEGEFNGSFPFRLTAATPTLNERVYARAG